MGLMAETGFAWRACGGTGGTVGMAVGVEAGGDGGGGGAAACASAAGEGAALAAAAAAPFLSLKRGVPPSTFPPSGTSSSSMTPAAGAGTCTDVLSVSISHTTSSSATESPTAFSHLTSPSETDSANAGVLTVTTSSLRTADVLKYLMWKMFADDGNSHGREFLETILLQTETPDAPCRSST